MTWSTQTRLQTRVTIFKFIAQTVCVLCHGFIYICWFISLDARFIPGWAFMILLSLKIHRLFNYMLTSWGGLAMSVSSLPFPLSAIFSDKGLHCFCDTFLADCLRVGLTTADFGFATFCFFARGGCSCVIKYRSKDTRWSYKWLACQLPHLSFWLFIQERNS